MIVLARPLSSVALAFGPVEYLWLSIFGLSLIASLSIGNVLKRLAGRAFGLLLSCVGVAEISADIRLTFGSSTMIGGIEVVSALIGLYCIPVLIDLVATPERHLKVEEGGRAVRFREGAIIAWRSGIAIMAGFYALFRFALGVPLP
jgi:putative tricarboxylic transport membrane protein